MQMSDEIVSGEFDFGNICRTCLSTKDLKLLYNDYSANVCLVNMLMTCTVVRFCETDGLPAQICSDCIYKISEAYKFALQCQETDKHLRNSIENRIKDMRNVKPATDYVKSCSDNKNSIINKPNMNSENGNSIKLSNKYVEKTNIESKIQIINLSIQNDHDYFYNENKFEISNKNDTETVDLLETSFNNLDNDFVKVKSLTETPIINCTDNHQNNSINYDISELLNLNNDKLPHCSASKSVNSATSHQIKYNVVENELKITKTCVKLIRNELKSTKIKNKPIYDCKKCGETFVQKSLLRDHFKNIPHKYTRKPCPICAKPVTYWYFLRHIESHKGLRPHICEVCGKSFVNDTNYKRHKNIHLGIKPFTCDVCGKGFAQSFSLKEHRRIHTGERPHICYKCGKAFRSSVYLKQHLDKHEKEDLSAENVLTEEPKLPITCEICNQVYTTLRGYKTHSVTHQEKLFCCPICCKCFITEYRLTMHKRYNHGHRKFVCEICNKAFSIRNSFKMHMLSHSGQKDHSCEVCLRKFNSLGHVRYHMLTHTGEKPHKCTVCSKAFAGNGNLVVHMRTHTGETPFLCPVCQKGFYDSSSMKKHLISHSKTK